MFGQKNMNNPKFDDVCVDCLNSANKIAMAYSSEYVTLETLLLSILSNTQVRLQIEEVVQDYDGLISKLEDFIESEIPKKQGQPPAETKRVEQVLTRALAQGLFYAQKEISALDLLLSILAEKDTWTVIQAKNHGITKKSIATQIGKTGGDKESGASKALQLYCVNMTAQAQAGKLDPCIGRDIEIDELEHILCRRSKHNALLIGDPGVGKTAIVEGFALKVIAKDVATELKDSEVWSLDIAALMAGTKYRGDLEERFKQVVSELSTRKKAVLFVDEAHMLNNSQQNSMDLSNMLKPALSRRLFKIIAATTWEDYRKSFEKDRAFMRRFNRVTITEPNHALCVDILKGLLPQYEKHHNVSVTGAEIDRIVSLTTKWVSDRKQPDKSIDILDAAMTRSRLQGLKKLDGNHVDIELSRVTMLPPQTFNQEKAKEITAAQIEIAVGNKVFGQDAAIEQVLERIYIAHAGLKNPERPMAQFLFLGPTGVGKTELARSLAEAMHLNFIRFDMSEYQEKHTVSKLIGAPPGYVGFDDSQIGGGLLISALEKNPHSVLLLDEIEKADPAVSNLLLQVMDSGWLTSSNGKRVDCRNIILILTSNLGATASERNSIGFTVQDRGDDEAATKEFFPPEFRNRLDAVVRFSKLGQVQILQVAKKFIDEVNQLLEPQNSVVELTDAAYELLVKEGYDSKMGARPMSRTVDKLIKVPLSKLLFNKKLKKGKKKTVFTFDIKDGVMVIN